MAGGKRASRKRTTPGILVVGAALTALLAIGGIAWALTAGEEGSPTASRQDTDGSGEPRAAAGAEALKACVTEVEAAEAVVGAARKGIGHWTEHIQAQTDLFSGENSPKETAAIFKRTRKAGPADQAAYDDATASFDKVDDPDAGGCADLPTKAADAADCSERMDALGAAMEAGKGGMTDWDSHLQAMVDHAAGEFGGSHAQMLWNRAYKAAPKNIKAFERADKTLDRAPACG